MALHSVYQIEDVYYEARNRTLGNLILYIVCFFNAYWKMFTMRQEIEHLAI